MTFEWSLHSVYLSWPTLADPLSQEFEVVIPRTLQSIDLRLPSLRIPFPLHGLLQNLPWLFLEPYSQSEVRHILHLKPFLGLAVPALALSSLLLYSVHALWVTDMCVFFWYPQHLTQHPSCVNSRRNGIEPDDLAHTRTRGKVAPITQDL